MTWSDQPSALDQARATLAERFPGKDIAIVECFDVAWSGWDGDSRGALITVDRQPMLVAIDQTIDERRFEQDIIERMPEYRRLLERTAQIMRSLMYARMSAGGPSWLQVDEDRLLTEIYTRVGYVENMGKRGRRHVLEALITATNEAIDFPEEVGRRRRSFDDAVAKVAPYFADDDATLRQLLKVNGGDKALDVDAMPIDEVRELLAKMRLLPDTGAYDSSALSVLQSITPRDRHLIDSKGRRLYPCPHDGESPSEWRERYERSVSRDAAISFVDEADLDARFVVLDDLPPEYRDVL